jgi:hypothetical protein
MSWQVIQNTITMLVVGHIVGGRWIFSVYLILPVIPGPGLHSASDRNEYQKQKNNLSCRLSRPAMANWWPAAWFIPTPAKSQVYFKKY